MNIKSISVLLVSLLFTNFAFSQTRFHHHHHQKNPIPVLTPGNNSFAYVAENADGIGGSLYLAKIIQTFPIVQARDVTVLENYYSGKYAVGGLGTSPDNRYLVSFRSYSSYYDYTDILEWDSFPDEMEMLFYDMQTGDYLGSIDYSPWGYLNESLIHSENLDEFRQQQIEAGVPPEVVAEYDFAVNNENSAIDFFDLHWNTDGTVSVTFDPEVWATSDDLFVDIGPELFTINYTVSPSGVSLESYGDIKTAATWPSVFDFSVEEPLPGNLQFEGQNILFPQKISLFPGFDITLPMSKKGVMIMGSIPEKFWGF